MPSVQDEARAQTSRLKELLKEHQTGESARSAAELLQYQAALKDCKEGERARGTRGQ